MPPSPKKKTAKPTKARTAPKTSGRANGKAHARQGVERARYNLKLPIRIGDAEVAVKAVDIAGVVRAREAVLEERREAAAKFRDRVKFFDERLLELSESIEQHTELRDVEVSEVLIVETNEIQVVRRDTGEIVSTRTASSEDVQERLELDAKASKKNGANPSLEDLGVEGGGLPPDKIASDDEADPFEGVEP